MKYREREREGGGLNVERDGYVEDKKNRLVGKLPEVVQDCRRKDSFIVLNLRGHNVSKCSV